jgi:DNA-binding transcriptional regulator LsrR (DeoR family)
MPAQRLTMRRIRELLRLHYGMGVSARAMARELGVSRSTVKEYRTRAAVAGLTWPLAEELAGEVLEERLLLRAVPGRGRAGGWSPTGQR